MKPIHITLPPRPEKIASRRSLSLKKSLEKNLFLSVLLFLLPMALLLTVCGGIEEDFSKPTKPRAWHVSTLAGGGSGSPDRDGAGTAIRFLEPYGMVQVGDTLYLSDLASNSIRTVHTTTARVGTIVTGSFFFPGYRDGSGTSALLSFPSSIVTKDGNTLYIADTANHRIRAVDLTSANNTVSTIAGSGTVGTFNITTGTITEGGYADGAGNAAQFKAPFGLAISGNTLYVADSANHRIRAIDLATKTVRDIAGDGTEKNRDGIGATAQFDDPSRIVVDGNTLYVTSGNLIRKLEYREVD